MFSLANHKRGRVNFSGSIVLAVITDFIGLFNKLSSKGALDGCGNESVSARVDLMGKREIVVRLMVSSSESDD